MTLVGDSVLHRTVRDDPLLEALSIQEHFPDYTVDNLAHGGTNSYDTLTSIEDYDFSKSDIVIISLGLNDAAPWKQVPLEDFIANYEAIIKTVGHERIVAIIPNPVDTQKQIAPGRDNKLIQEYGDAVAKLAQKHHLQTTDMYKTVIQHDDAASLYTEDGLHFNSTGYQLLFNELALHIK